LLLGGSIAVRAERPIREIVESLRGAAKDKWLEKWARWLDELLEVYDVEDPSEVLGFSDVYDLASLQSFLLEYCSDLVESECLRRVDLLIREKGYRRKITEEVAESMLDYIKSVEKRPEVLYGFPATLRSEIEAIRARPELDSGKVFQIVYSFLTGEGVDPEEARRVAEEIAATIPKVAPAKRAEVLETTLATARLAKQRTLLEWARRTEKAREVVEKAAKTANESVVYAVIEELNLRGVHPTLTEIREELRRWGYSDGVEEILRTLATTGMVVEHEGRYYLPEFLPEFARPPPPPPPKVVKDIRVVSSRPEDYIHPSKELAGVMSRLGDIGLTYMGRYYRCLDYIGAYGGWVVHIYTDTGVTYKGIALTAWQITLPRGKHYFVAVKGREVYVFVCSV